MTPAKLNAPISRTAPEGIKLALQEQQLKCAKFEKELEEMKIEIEKASIAIDDEMSNVVSILSNVSNKEMTPFMQLFWQQQKKNAAKKCQRNSLLSNDNSLFSVSGH